MLLRVLKEDFKVDFRHYGEITMPKGTMTSHKTAMGEDPAYNFVCEFDWIDKHYPEIANTLKAEAQAYGINIPEDMLMPALRVKFLSGDPGYCRDMFYSTHTKQKYCRMETGNGFAGWYSLTPDWEEPDCPLRTDILIQITDRDGKVAITEQQREENGDYKAEKKCLFSWERNSAHELSEVSVPIYREEKTGYIIDKVKGFRGFVETTVGEDGIVHYTDSLTFEEYKKVKGNENLVIIDEEQLEEETRKYKRSRMKVFEEIPEEEFYRLYECLPPVRPRKRCGAFSFFMQEADILSLHTFCFKYNGKYYKGVRDIEQKERELEHDIQTFLTYFTLEYDNLLKLSGEYHHRHRDNGGASEFDSSINDISRAIVHKFREKHGQCFLGKVNLYDEERKKLDVRLVPYDGQPIYNFEYGFVIPCHDDELIDMIKEHNREKVVFDSAAIMEGINKIFNRIYELSGTALSWS